jgi:hypothetical protein
MHNLKVWTFHPNSRNAIVFMVLAALFLVLQQSLQSGLPFMNAAFLKKVAADEWAVLIFFIPALISTLQQRRSSPKLFALYVSVVAFRSLEGLFLDFNKLVLLVLFFHIVISYGFYQLLTWTYSRAAFSPNFRSDNLYTPMGRVIESELAIDSQILNGRLTNWDEDGAFFWLEDSIPKNAQDLLVKVKWENHVFQAKGTIVSATWDGKGIGIEWADTSVKTEEGWNNLMALFSDYGYDPRLLR